LDGIIYPSFFFIINLYLEEIMIKFSIIMISITLPLSMTACAQSTPTTAPSVDTKAPSNTAVIGGSQGVKAADAQTLYKHNCMACHGNDLSGVVGPNLQKVGARLSSDQIVTQISNGKGAMPPFKGTLKAEEINALAQWLVSNK
jgi:cytochrome c551